MVSHVSRMFTSFALEYSGDMNQVYLICLFVHGFTPYQQYYSCLTATVHKFMFPGLFSTSP